MSDQQARDDRVDQTLDRVEGSMSTVDEAMVGITGMAEATVALAASNRELAAEMRASTAVLSQRARGNGRLIIVAIILVIFVGIGVVSIRAAQSSNRQTLSLLTTATSNASRQEQAAVLKQTILCLENHSDINAAKLQGMPPIPLRPGCPTP